MLTEHVWVFIDFEGMSDKDDGMCEATKKREKNQLNPKFRWCRWQHVKCFIHFLFVRAE